MMMPRQRGENSDDNQFSFSGPMAIRGSDEFETWAERIKSDYGYFGRSGKMKQVGAWAKRNHVNPDEGEFAWMAKEDDEDVPSPTLWEKEGGSPASKSDEAYPILGHTIRSQMIARYRKEMIDLVRDAPENAYELSLRDIVEIPRPVKSAELEEKKGEKEKEMETKKETKKKGGRRMARSESLDTGLLLKMFIPATMGRRKSFGVNGTCSKVSPKPVIADAEKGGGPEKGPDSEWWKKTEINESSGSSSSGSSGSGRGRGSSSSGRSGSTSSNNSSGNRNINNTKSSNTGRRKKNGCLPFLHIFKSKNRRT
ncbi:hypothetical protein IHE45_10G069400 [Dioscorea alata]|uniref:Uncharacterized protein n=1 Tax=Dioscorea alata TaxID=55571 RepID=A0ACB7VBZ3_DIOAL|nr:hypothetical protein IHE45_10G069400 [Dioscorea alata]